MFYDIKASFELFRGICAFRGETKKGRRRKTETRTVTKGATAKQQYPRFVCVFKFGGGERGRGASSQTATKMYDPLPSGCGCIRREYLIVHQNIGQ